MKKFFVVLCTILTATLSACRSTPEGEKAGNVLVEAETKPESEALVEAEVANIPESFQLVIENEDGSLNIDAAVVKGEASVTEGTVEARAYTLDEIQAVFAPEETFEKSEEMSNEYDDVWLSGGKVSANGLLEWDKMISLPTTLSGFEKTIFYQYAPIDKQIELIMESAPLPEVQKELAEKRTKEYIQALGSNFVPATFQYSSENGVGWTRVGLLLGIDGRFCSYGQLDENMVTESDGISVDSGTEAAVYGEFQFSDNGELGSANITNEYCVKNQTEVKILPFEKIEERIMELFDSKLIHPVGEIKIEQIQLEYMLQLKVGEKEGTYVPVWAFKYKPTDYAYEEMQNYVLINAQTGELGYYSGV